MRTGPLLILTGLLSVPAAAVAAEDTLSCNSQINLACQESCEVNPTPAALNFDFANKTGEYCRGPQCLPGTLNFTDEGVLGGGRTYRLFSLIGAEGNAFSVAGAIDIESKTFFATTSDFPTLLGTCE